MKIGKVIEYIKKPYKFLIKLDQFNFIRLKDETYLKLLYKSVFNEKLDLENPVTFNEKLQWLKLYDRKEIYTTMVDKNEVKKYVANIIGEEYIIPTLGIYDKFEEIDFDELPNKFVIKCTHDSESVIICRNKNNFNREEAKIKINKCLKRNMFFIGREWPYKNVKPRIIIEKYMEEVDSDELKDYKFFCFNGICRLILVCSERFSSSNMCETFFDNEWNYIDVKENNHRVDKSVKKPKNLERMIEITEKISNSIPFLRVDLYEINNKIYFGETTFYPTSGFEKFEPSKYNNILGEWIDLDAIGKYVGD